MAGFIVDSSIVTGEQGARGFLLSAESGNFIFRLKWPYFPIFVACVLLICTACSQKDGWSAPTGDPMVDNLRLARDEIAGWGKDVVLFRVGSRYTAEAGELVHEDHTYLFVSTDGGASYYLVRIHADGEISSGPVAGSAIVDSTGYDFSMNAISERETLDIAWEQYGADVVARCGPLRWVDVGGGIGDGQWWRVGYRVGGTLYTVFLNSATGEIIEMDEISC